MTCHDCSIYIVKTWMVRRVVGLAVFRVLVILCLFSVLHLELGVDIYKFVIVEEVVCSFNLVG